MAESLDFDSLVAQFYEPLYQFAFSLSREEASACDLTQQTFCVWAAKGHQLRDSSKVKTWLFTTLHREFLGSRRRQTRFPHVELETAAAELPTIAPETIARLDATQALDALAQMDEIYQAPVALFYLQDYSYQEIAGILDVPLGTVKSRLARGLAKLQQLLNTESGATAATLKNMNREEAKMILLRYRPGTPDAGDPQIAAALALAEGDAALKDWFAQHCAQQNALRQKFREIKPPAGLKEQIISEHAAEVRRRAFQRNLVMAGVALILGGLLLATFWRPPLADDDTFAIFRSRMVSTALRGYTMDLNSDNPNQIRNYLTQNHAPADYVLPAPLKKVTPTGCSIEGWQAAKVAMICFHTGKTAADKSTDLWLFVVDRRAVKNLPENLSDLKSVELAKVNQMTTAVWLNGDKLYLLGMKSDAAAVRQFL